MVEPSAGEVEKATIWPGVPGAVAMLSCTSQGPCPPVPASGALIVACASARILSLLSTARTTTLPSGSPPPFPFTVTGLEVSRVAPSVGSLILIKGSTASVAPNDTATESDARVEPSAGELEKATIVPAVPGSVWTLSWTDHGPAPPVPASGASMIVAASARTLLSLSRAWTTTLPSGSAAPKPLTVTGLAISSTAPFSGD